MRVRRLLVLVAAVSCLAATGLVPGFEAPVAHASAPQLTGTFYGDDNSVYYLQQIGNQVWWMGESVDADANTTNGALLGPGHVWSHGLASTSVFQGTVNGAELSGKWVEVSRGTAMGAGTVSFDILNVTTDQTRTRLELSGGTVPSRASGAPALSEMTSGDPIDDDYYQYPDGHTEYMPFFDRLFNVKKGINQGGADISVNDDVGDPLASTDDPAQLRPYRDQTLFYGELVTNNQNGKEAAHLNLPTTDLRLADGLSYNTFACHANDGDLDLRLQINKNRIPTDFPTADLAPYDPGVGWSSDNATAQGENGYDHIDVLRKFANIGASTTDTVLSDVHFGSENDAIKNAQGITDDHTSYIGTEGVMYAGNQITNKTIVDGIPVYTCLTQTPPLLMPGWAQKGGNSILVNSRPINGDPANIGVDEVPACRTTSQTGINALTGLPLAAADPDNTNTDPLNAPQFCTAPGYGTQVRVTGPLILDCGHSEFFSNTSYFVDGSDTVRHDCDQDDGADFECLPGFCGYNVTEPDQNQELHPFYSYDIIECPLGDYPADACPNEHVRRNLTGAWGGEDGSTYYVRQMGDQIWWAGLRRNRDPIQNTAAIPIPNPTNVFTGTITYDLKGTATISGTAVTVPKGLNAGGGSTQATFKLNANDKHFDLTSISDPTFPMPSHFDKLYEPKEDTTAPGTALGVGSPKYQATRSGPVFVNSSTPFTVSASDDTGGQGVQAIWYRYYRDGSGPIPPPYTPIDFFTPEPSTSQTSFVLSGPDGDYTVQSFAEDASGNVGDVNTRHVTLDNAAPIATINQPTATNYTRDQQITLNYSVSDGTGSGVQSFTPTFDGSTANPSGGTLATGQIIDLLTPSIGTGPHVFTVSATDNLGNTGSTPVTFSVVVTAASIQNEVKRFVSAGKIKSPGLISALLAKLVEAANYRAVGDCADAKAAYQSFINQVTGQSGKNIDPSAAKILIQDAQYLIAHCP